MLVFVYLHGCASARMFSCFSLFLCMGGSVCVLCVSLVDLVPVLFLNFCYLFTPFSLCLVFFFRFLFLCISRFFSFLFLVFFGGVFFFFFFFFLGGGGLFCVLTLVQYISLSLRFKKVFYIVVCFFVQHISSSLRLKPVLCIVVLFFSSFCATYFVFPSLVTDIIYYCVL